MADSQHTQTRAPAGAVAALMRTGLSRREAQRTAREARRQYRPAWMDDPRCPRCATMGDCSCLVGVPKSTQAMWHRIMPIHYFPDDHRAWIDEQVSWDKPPERWRGVGPSDALRPLAYIENRAWIEWHWSRGIYPDAKRDPIPAHIRQAVMLRDGLMCQICMTPVERDDIHLDHIKPWSRGGQHTVENLRVTHSICNIRRGAPSETDELVR